MAKQRATQHNGRKSSKGAYSTKHNDRNYDYVEAPNIDETKTDNNLYWNRYDGYYNHKDREGKLTFEEAEQRFYKEVFTKQWERTNQRYESNGHKERCKSFDDWCKMDCNLPEESYMQIGDKENPATIQQFHKVARLFLSRQAEWNKQHGFPFSMVDFAYHFDEAVPQLHTRKLWKYKDKDGIYCIGQEKALEQAGVPLPDPSKPKSRYNNRKMTFDKEMREMYLQCCLECGLEVETEPLKGVRHNLSKDEVLNVKLAQKEKDLEAKEQQLNNREKELNEREAWLYDREENLKICMSEMEDERNDILQIQTPTAYLDDFWKVYPSAKEYYDKYVNERHEDFKNSRYYRNLMSKIDKEVKLNESLAPKQPKQQQYRGWDIGD